MFILVLLFGMFMIVTGAQSNNTLSNGDILYAARPSCVRLSAIINVKWVYQIGAKDVTDDAGYL